MRIAFILVEHRRHLVLVNGEHQLLHFQTAMIVDGVEIGDLAVLVIQCSMEIVSVSNTDARINNQGIIRRIDGQVKPDNTVATVDGVIRIGLLTGVII